MAILRTFLIACAVAALALVIAYNGRIYEKANALLHPEERSTAGKSAAASLPIPQEAAQAAEGTAADTADSEAKQHYLDGMKYFQSGNYDKAKAEWLEGKKLAPNDKDIQAGLARIDAILAPPAPAAEEAPAADK